MQDADLEENMRYRSHPPEEHARLGAFLKSARQARKVTQKHVADLMDEPQSNISRIESGQRQLLVLELLDYCKAIGIDAEDLIAQYRRSLKKG